MLLLPGTSAFQYFDTAPFFDYLSRPENQEQENTFNHLMTAFTTTLDSAAKLHVSHSLWQIEACMPPLNGLTLMMPWLSPCSAYISGLVSVP
jgi:hypothetical protein